MRSGPEKECEEENLVNAGFEVGGAFEACVARAFGVRI